ncbi:tape measure protein [Metarhizium guizhouense ARSEF 977]|uniref:Tape measure protein n=1 Tax=Metarhizium guizhouense (strain ARSEF 977) TaxID=1276136 RepID=A0A0B4GEU6_METGA|nr:tape measure protein [Metarhizium guizhouense ARSEF 977]
MKFSAALVVAAMSAAPAAALPTDITSDTDRGVRTFGSLTELQSKYARGIIAQAKKEHLGSQGCIAGIATALVESTLIMHANYAVPDSLAYEYDRLGHDADSIGLFQQRASIYTNIKCSMDVACSAHQFFNGMKKVPDWRYMDVGKLCQEVQRSENPERYHEFINQAKGICQQGGF